MFEECLMSWTAWDPGKAENWFVASLCLKHCLRQYGVEGGPSAETPSWATGHYMQVCTGTEWYLEWERGRCWSSLELVRQVWSPVSFCISSLLKFMQPWWLLPNSESGDIVLLKEVFLLPYWPRALVQKGLLTQPRWAKVTLLVPKTLMVALKNC